MKLKRILLVLLILTLAFIWGHSMVPGTLSADESGRALKLLYPLLSIFLDPKYITNHLVRKMAHFTEYAVLGMELRTLIGMYHRKGKAVLFNKDMVFVPTVLYAFLLRLLMRLFRYLVAEARRYLMSGWMYSGRSVARG